MKSGSYNTRAIVRAALSEMKADSAAGVHRNASRFNSCVSGVAISPDERMNFR
jgi:hypothetical protein